eukprot:SAG31_NODE_1608_length_7760_cov_3.045425_3_plen_628_part_00
MRGSARSHVRRWTAYGLLGTLCLGHLLLSLLIGHDSTTMLVISSIRESWWAILGPMATTMLTVSYPFFSSTNKDQACRFSVSSDIKVFVLLLCTICALMTASCSGDIRFSEGFHAFGASDDFRIPQLATETAAKRHVARRMLTEENQTNAVLERYIAMSQNAATHCQAPTEIPSAERLLHELAHGHCLNMIDEISHPGACDHLVASGLACDTNFAPGKPREGECDVTCGYCTQEFDYIVVGGGTSGCVLARRLSDNPNATVLLLEDSIDPRVSKLQQIVETPRLMYQTWDEDTLTTTAKSLPLAASYGRRVDVLAGRGLGGTTAINAGLYTRPELSDFDEWGLEGWTAEDARRYFRRLEDHEVASSTHGQGGPLHIEKGETQSIARMALLAAEAVGLPTSNGSSDGISIAHRTIKDGRRLDAFSAYIKPVLNRPNLHVQTNSRALKLIMKQGVATGVSYAAFGVNKVDVMAKREVIISAGVYGSAQLLLLSGIGPQSELQTHNIRSRVDLPVGKNLIGRPMVNLVYSGAQLTPEQDHRQLQPNSTAWQHFTGNGTGILSLSASSIYSPMKSTPELQAPDFVFELIGALPRFKTVPTAVMASCQLATASSKGSVYSNNQIRLLRLQST